MLRSLLRAADASRTNSLRSVLFHRARSTATRCGALRPTSVLCSPMIPGFGGGVPGLSDLLTSPLALGVLLKNKTQQQTGQGVAPAAEAAPSGSENDKSTAGAGGSSSQESGGGSAPSSEAGGGGNDGGGASGNEKSGWFRSFVAANRSSISLGAVILCVTALWEAISSQKNRIVAKAGEQMFVTLELRSHQPEFDMVMDWLSEQEISRHSRNLTCRSVYSRGLWDDDEDDALDALLYDELPTTTTTSAETSAASAGGGGDASGKQEANVQELEMMLLAQKRKNLVLGYGTHLVPFHGRLLWVTRSIDDSKKHIQSFSRHPDEILTIVILGRDRSLVDTFMSEVRQASSAEASRTVGIHLLQEGEWYKLCNRLKRPLDTIYLPTATMKLSEEIDRFLRMRREYMRLGVPWRRGYLFEGPPGTGKSSFIFALAGHLKMPVYLMNLRGDKVSDDTVLRSLNSLPARSVVVLEDLDTVAMTSASATTAGKSPSSSPVVAGSDTISHNSKEKSAVTVSGLLNAIDGVASSEGRVLVVTANDSSKIPPALLRPGRIDRHVHFSHMSSEDIKAMILKFTDDESSAGKSAECKQEQAEAIYQRLVSSLAGGGGRVADGQQQQQLKLTPAELQNVLLSARLASPSEGGGALDFAKQL